MAEASPLLLTVTPKDLGKHLRDVRRRKGLSLSEVARGAGLSRRELVAYERGKVPIPESDLWVLAGSCGVDASELVPRTAVPELTAAPTSMGDTVAQLRRTQDDASLAPYLATLNRLQALPPGKKVPVKERELEEIATALGREPDAIESRLRQVMQVSPAEATRLRELILPTVGGPHRPRAIESAPQFTEMAAEAPGSVDVFEELARLPEPLPLPDPGEPLPDMFAAPPPPDGAVELVDGTGTPAGVAAAAHGLSATTAGGPTLASLDGTAASRSGADAPPIDVALRESSDGWADWGKPAAPLSARITPTGPPDTDASQWVDPAAEGAAWSPPPWQPAGDDGEPFPGGPPSFWEGTDDWTPPGEDVESPEADLAPAEQGADAWTSHDWPHDLSGETAPVDPPGEPFDPSPAPAYEHDYDPIYDAGYHASAEAAPWAMPADPAPAPSELAPLEPMGADPDAGPWAHEPDPEAVSTGFYVDWGDPDASDEPPAWHALIGAEPATDAAADLAEPGEPTGAPADAFDVPMFPSADPAFPSFETSEASETSGGFAPFEPDDTFAVAETEPFAAFDAFEPPAAEDDDALPPIMWRADGLVAPATGLDVEPEPDDLGPRAGSWADDAHRVADVFVSAGNDWQLGNALPLVEVRGQGALVMRRADERWALADVTTSPDCAVEVDVDFRSGPGLGVLFRAGVDAEGRMSGYSFDIDPIYDGGGYLVRQWQADRELWNPIARVSAADPDSMYGALTVRLVLQGDHLVALVNGVEVLTVESLKQASADRGREAADGNRVGVQAWSSSDLVIETLRVAEH
jgi:transcriptional regulator with XRE-family HTH domain